MERALKTFTNNKGTTFVFVDVPEDAHKFLIERYPSINEYQSLWFYENHGVERLHPKASIKLPQGNYELIGLSKDVSEEVAAEIVDYCGGHLFDRDLNAYHQYEDYSLTDHPFQSKWFYSATESLSSLVQSLELNNPIILKLIE